MQKLKATLRIEKHSDEITLFFYDERGYVIADSLTDGNVGASYEYYRTETLPAHIHADAEAYKRACDEYIRRYSDNRVNVKLIIKKQLTR